MIGEVTSLTLMRLICTCNEASNGVSRRHHVDARCRTSRPTVCSACETERRARNGQAAANATMPQCHNATPRAQTDPSAGQQVSRSRTSDAEKKPNVNARICAVVISLECNAFDSAMFPYKLVTAPANASCPRCTLSIRNSHPTQFDHARRPACTP